MSSASTIHRFSSSSNFPIHRLGAFVDHPISSSSKPTRRREKEKKLHNFISLMEHTVQERRISLSLRHTTHFLSFRIYYTRCRSPQKELRDTRKDDDNLFPISFPFLCEIFITMWLWDHNSRNFRYRSLLSVDCRRSNNVFLLTGVLGTKAASRRDIYNFHSSILNGSFMLSRVLRYDNSTWPAWAGLGRLQLSNWFPECQENHPQNHYQRLISFDMSHVEKTITTVSRSQLDEERFDIILGISWQIFITFYTLFLIKEKSYVFLHS